MDLAADRDPDHLAFELDALGMAANYEFQLLRDPAVFDRAGAAMRAIFIQIKCEMGQAYRVAREMADSIPELSEMHSTSGQYDLLGKFYLEPDQDIGLFVVERVQSVPGVKDTYTLQTFNAFSGGRG